MTRSYFRILLCSLLSCVTANLGEASERSLEAARLSLQAVLEQAVIEYEAPGAVALIGDEEGTVAISVAGMAEIETQRVMTSETIFCIASMTKPISATAVMLCRDAGLLSLDDPISKFIPEFAKTETGGTAGFTPITVGHLLSHTSGLGGAQRVHDSLASTAAEIAGRPRLFEPGSRWRYSPGINVAARIVEIVSGQVFAAFLQQRIFDPLEMRDTSFHPSPAQLARLAVLYRPVKGSSQWLPATSWISQLDPHQPPNPSASLFSTAGDLARFYRMFLAGGVVNGHRFLSTASLQEMTRTHTSGLIAGFSPGNAWGLGWELILQPQGVNAVLSPGTYGHFGAFGTQGWIDPQRRIFFVLLVQRVGFGDDVANSVLRERFQHAVMGPLRR